MQAHSDPALSDPEEALAAPPEALFFDPNDPVGRERQLYAAEAQTASDFAPPERHLHNFNLRGHSQSLLMDVSQPLLSLVSRVGSLQHFNGADALHRQLCIEIESLELELAKANYETAVIQAHRYCLCSVLDEAIMSSPWGMDGDWSERSLLAIYHNETWGGEKFYYILDRVKRDPERYIDLLEFMFYAMCLGFMGQYRARVDGKQHFDRQLHDLERIIIQQRGELRGPIIEPLANVKAKEHRVARQTPTSLVWIGFVVLALLIYLGFYFTLNQQTDDIVEQMRRFLSVI